MYYTPRAGLDGFGGEKNLLPPLRHLGFGCETGIRVLANTSKAFHVASAIRVYMGSLTLWPWNWTFK
jgi:hypothetical protein